jgi:hypothetical protein
LSIESPSELTFLHHLYIISFSIFYDVMLHTLKGLRAFDTTAAFTGNAKPLARFALSILFLNLLPFLHFSIILLYLLHYLHTDIFSILLVFAMSISIFGYDKVFHAMLIRGSKRLYTESELESVVNFSDSMRRKFASHYLQSLIPGLLYVLVPLGLLLLAFDAVWGLIIISCSIIGSFIVWYRWRFPRVQELDQRSSE